jgi:hypothetical protein
VSNGVGSVSPAMAIVVGTALALASCASAQRAGRTPEGHPMWRIECPPAGGCNAKARKVCGGDYTTLNDGDSYNMFTYKGQATVARRRRMLIACLGNASPQLEPLPPDRQQQRAEAIATAEPMGATPDVRCAYWREHVERTADVPSTKRLRKWLLRRASEACAEVAEPYRREAQPPREIEPTEAADRAPSEDLPSEQPTDEPLNPWREEEQPGERSDP